MTLICPVTGYCTNLHSPPGFCATAGLLFATSRAGLGCRSGGETAASGEQLWETGGDWERGRETDRLLLGTCKGRHGGFGNPVSEQSSVTQEQEWAKGPSISCEDRVGRRGAVYQLWYQNLSRSLLL